MPKTMTPQEFGAAMRQLPEGLPRAILDATETTITAALKFSVTEFFEGGGGPPNPPPGPLKIRSGDLRRGIEIVAPVQRGLEFLSGLQVLDPPYGRKHELGEDLPARPFLEPAIQQAADSIFSAALGVAVEDLARSAFR